MNWLARILSREEAAEESHAAEHHAAANGAAPSGAVEELSALLREARGKARAARQRGRVMQRDGRMSEALRAFKAASEYQVQADRLERERALIRRAG